MHETPEEIKRYKLIEGAEEPPVLPHQLTHWSQRDDIEFAVDQLKQYSASYQIRKRNDDKFAVYVDRPELMEEF